MEDDMKLYYAPGACSLAPHIALCEAGLAFDMEKVDLRSKTTEDGRDYRTVNPKGQVPALAMDDGSILTENAAVLQYIGDRAENLVPEAHSMERYRTQEWLSYIGSELHKNFGPLFGGAEGEAKTSAITNLKKKFAFVNESLAGGGYLLGEAFSIADCYAFAVLRWTSRFKIDLDDLPNVKAYLDRVAARPKVGEAMAAEGLSR